MKKNLKLIINNILPFISGVMVSFSFCFENLAFLIIFSLVPLMYSFLLNPKVYKIYIYSMTVYILSFSWLNNPIYKINGNLFIQTLIFLFALIGISLILSFFIVLPFCIFRLAKFSKIKTAIIFPFMYILGEWLQGAFYPFALPWLRLGNIISGYTIFIQPASVFGTLFISLLILYVNIFTVLFIIYFKSKKKYLFITAELFIVISDMLFGIQSINSEQRSDYNIFSAVIVQGNYPNKSKCDPIQTLEKYIGLSNTITDKTDLILFPETSIKSCIYENNDSKEKLFNLCTDRNAVLLFGSQYNVDNTHYNACIVTTPGKEVNAGYFKRILVPYGEYTPVKIKFLNFLSSEFSHSKKNDIINIPDEKIGCIICFESIFSNAVRDTVRKGAEVIAVLTNDSWLGYNIPLFQHHSHSIMRAVEYGRYVLTSANTGISSVINNKGKVIAQSQLNKEYVIYENYRLNNKVTLYTKLGDIIVLPSCFIIILSCISFFIRIISVQKHR